ncbi:MAG TPA: cytochrome-c oxidase, cbb3-type subunit III [Xanthobacteraceae bacterium]|nr:cytochrome-c oxidase, cbb3-type subunit III [Xanthobacteraceae bacterium]
MFGRSKADKKPPTKVGTTGHEWDGIHELNTPLPRWWLWLFYATIIWSIGYWVVYPAWPLISSYSNGLFNWHARDAVARDLAALQVQRGPMMTRLASASLQEIESTPELLDFARIAGRRAFADNCAPCHGAGGGGAKGYPNLVDNDWLWGGKLDDIAQTIRHGVRAGDDQGHQGSMPAFGRDGLLKADDISAAADYVRSLSGLATEPGADLARGAKIFADNCAVCHGPQGKGNREVGAPNLTDQIWLYGPEKKTIMEGIWNGRDGVMPAWGSKLDDATLKALTIYVHTLGGGE